MRRRRQRALWRAFRARRQLVSVANRTSDIASDSIVVVSTLRNERVRLPYFLQYYREMGVGHFIFVDNDSDDGTREFLADQPDVSLWHTTASYKDAQFGVDWMNWLSRKYCHDRWTLTVDVDEFLVFPHCDTRPLRALTDWLNDGGVRSFPAMLLDMYPKGPIDARPYAEGQDPFETLEWFDAGNYVFNIDPDYFNLWIQGGPRMRLFFEDAPKVAPSLNKIPLVKWHRRFAYVQSTHMLLPRGLNLTYEKSGGEKVSGVLLHAKFLDTFPDKTREELVRQQHYSESREYRAYQDKLGDAPELWCSASERYINWRQLEIIGLMSKGNWT